jgi:hypothetical protein
MAIYQVPLSQQEAETIAHAFETVCLMASLQRSTMDDTERYGRFRFIMRGLLRGESVEIDEAWLARSREIMTRVESHPRGRGAGAGGGND